jgi:hypothetical protein
MPNQKGSLGVKGLIYIVIQLNERFVLELGSSSAKCTFGRCPNVEFATCRVFIE